MTRDEAEAVARDLYPEHREAAAALILQACDPLPSLVRRRAAQALALLDPSRPVPSDDILALVECVVYGLDRHEREEAANRIWRAR